MNITEAILIIKEKINFDNKKTFLIAIDGRCAAGKTTFADILKQELNCNIIHTDHFFLRTEQRTKERYEEPGGNIDLERLIDEVMIPLSQGQPFSYQAFDCKLMALFERIHINPKDVTVIEGSYSCHPCLKKYYDLMIFLNIDKDLQIKRIIQRNGSESEEIFRNKWIPLEEKYFNAYDVINYCDLVVES